MVDMTIGGTFKLLTLTTLHDKKRERKKDKPMPRKLFCEISPLTYKISVLKCQILRSIQCHLVNKSYANEFHQSTLPFVTYKHNSLIRRTLGDVDVKLQENKAINLGIAALKVNNILIRPKETFSFWKLVGRCTSKKGYKTGLVIKRNMLGRGLGGGLCQFTNLIHWMILHSSMDIVEHHHHNSVDLFPDFNRQIPFGTGTSIMYNYLDYQFTNNTDNTFQLKIYTTETHLCGELRCLNKLKYNYHIVEEDSFYTHEEDGYYRNNKIYREISSKETGLLVNRELILTNHSKVMYDAKHIPEDKLFHVRCRNTAGCYLCGGRRVIDVSTVTAKFQWRDS